MKDRTLLGLIGVALVIVFVVGAILVSSGCAVRGDSGIRARLASAYGTLDAVTESVDESYRQGDIDAEQFLDFHENLVNAKNGLDAAKAAIDTGNLETAKGKIDLAISILNVVQAQIAEDESDDS